MLALWRLICVLIQVISIEILSSISLNFFGYCGGGAFFSEDIISFSYFCSQLVKWNFDVVDLVG